MSHTREFIHHSYAHSPVSVNEIKWQFKIGVAPWAGLLYSYGIYYYSLSHSLCHLPYGVPSVEKEFVFVEAKDYFWLFKTLVTSLYIFSTRPQTSP